MVSYRLLRGTSARPAASGKPHAGIPYVDDLPITDGETLRREVASIQPTGHAPRDHQVNQSVGRQLTCYNAELDVSVCKGRPAIAMARARSVGVVPMSGQRRLIRRRHCSDLSAGWCAWQGYRLAAGRNNQRLSRKASSGSGGW